MKIILITGPSGAGKDSLLQSAEQYYADRNSIIFVPRYVTRMPDKNEHNYFVDEQAFFLLRDHDFFLAHWAAHGNLYGVGRHALLDRKGVRIVSVSRTVVSRFEEQFTKVHTVLVTAPPSTLLDRIQQRRRESVAGVASRLDRLHLSTQARALHVFDNSGPLSQTTPRFFELLDQLIGRTTTPEYRQVHRETVKEHTALAPSSG